MENNDKYIGTLLDDRYEILQVIGEGGMAIVYKALDHRLNRNVAVKIMREDMLADEEFRSRFCAEAHAVAMLSHPNIVAVYDVSHSDAMEYIVMELVEGITLSTAPTTRSEALEPVVLEVDEPEPVFVVELAAVLMRLVTSSSTP